uniref:Uncharacterized protein n=1 Tax=Ditylenchus dipsaci TaxID=166011 RepID=A0A915DHM0_9BILA
MGPETGPVSVLFLNSQCISAAFSYTDGCPNFFQWSDGIFYVKDGRKMSTRCECGILLAISISSIIVAGLLILVLIYICLKCEGGQANCYYPASSVSGELKQGPKPVPIQCFQCMLWRKICWQCLQQAASRGRWG